VTIRIIPILTEERQYLFDAGMQELYRRYVEWVETQG
jgi:hypothetical protein